MQTWLFWRVRSLVCDEQSIVTHSTVCTSGVLPFSARVCTAWGINRVLLRILICSFRATLLDVTSRIERLHICYYCADVRRVLAHFCSEYSRARPSTACVSQLSWRAMFTRAISCSRSIATVSATARPIHRTPVRKTHYRQAVCSE